MREREYINWLVYKENFKMSSAIRYKNYIKKVEEIIGMDIDYIYIEYKQRNKETDPFEILLKEITTTPKHMEKREKKERSKWGSAIRKYKEFYYDQEV